MEGKPQESRCPPSRWKWQKTAGPIQGALGPERLVFPERPRDDASLKGT